MTAHYEYDAFGKEVAESTALVYEAENPFRFSTKYFDDETGFNYYSHRHYNPDQGGWVSRDPLGERASKNLYGIVRNSPATSIDVLGGKELKIVIVPIPSRVPSDGGDRDSRDKDGKQTRRPRRGGGKPIPGDGFDDAEQALDAGADADMEDPENEDTIWKVANIKQARENLEGLSTTSGDCVKSLTIRGHGGPGEMVVGSLFPRSKTTVLNARAIDKGFFDGVEFCDDCTITLSGCQVFKDSDVYGSDAQDLKMAIEMQTECKPFGFVKKCHPSRGGGEATNIDGNGPIPAP